jgi:hypothetical protein
VDKKKRKIEGQIRNPHNSTKTKKKKKKKKKKKAGKKIL